MMQSHPRMAAPPAPPSPSTAWGARRTLQNAQPLRVAENLTGVLLRPAFADMGQRPPRITVTRRVSANFLRLWKTASRCLDADHSGCATAACRIRAFLDAAACCYVEKRDHCV